MNQSFCWFETTIFRPGALEIEAGGVWAGRLRDGCTAGSVQCSAINAYQRHFIRADANPLKLSMNVDGLQKRAASAFGGRLVKAL
jgi:hypothetical protein